MVIVSVCRTFESDMPIGWQSIRLCRPIRRYTKSVLSKRWKLLLRRYADSPASSSVALERRKFGVRNQEVANELKRILPVAALNACRTDFRTSYS